MKYTRNGKECEAHQNEYNGELIKGVCRIVDNETFTENYQGA